MFFEREEELKTLNFYYEQPKSSLIFLFGRKGIGKTSLINNFSLSKKVLQISCVELMEKIFFNNMSKMVNNFFETKTNKKIDSFENFLFLIAEQNIDNKVLIVIEDFHKLQKIQKNSLELLNEFWQKNLKSKNIQLVVTSSIFESNPYAQIIYSKATDNIFVRDLSVEIVKTMIPELNKNDLMYVFTAFGTNPTLLNLYDIKKDFLLNVKNIFIFKESSFLDYGINLLKEELSDIVTYSSILYSISMGNNKIGDIAKFLDVKSSYLTRYIQKLVDLMIISKNVPVNDDINKSKFGRYLINDNFLKFWFCYIYPFVSFIEKNDFYSIVSFIRKDFSKRLVHDAYKKYIFNLIKNDPLKYLGYEPNHLGGWWNNKENEIDIVSYNSKDITFIDCKWRKKDSSEKYYKQLKDKSNFFETTLNCKYIIFAKN